MCGVHPVTAPEVTAIELTVQALAEVNPAVAAAVEAVGPNSVGYPLPGWLGWLTRNDRVDLIRACCLAHTAIGETGWDTRDVDYEAMVIAYNGAWTHHEPGQRMWHERIEPGVRAWMAVAAPDDDQDEMLLLIAIAGGIHRQARRIGGPT
jgi:hypothetical protein